MCSNFVHVVVREGGDTRAKYRALPVAIVVVAVVIDQGEACRLWSLISPVASEYLFLAGKYLSQRMLFALKEATHGTRRHETGVLVELGRSSAASSEQHEIVRRVEALFALADQIETRYQKAKTYVDKLTQSILAKAFRGELVPQ